MKKNLVTILVAISILFVWLWPARVSSATGTATFTGLGDLPGGDYYSMAHGISADGLVVVGQSRSTLSDPSIVLNGEAFIWDSVNGMRGLGFLPGENNRSSYSMATSADGSVVVGAGRSGGQAAFIWDGVNGIRAIDELPGVSISVAWDISSDGSVVVGYIFIGSNYEAFIWDSVKGMRGLGDLPGGISSSMGIAVSADGSVVVGSGSTGATASSSEAFIWDSVNGMRGLGDLPGGNFKSVAYGVSADGSIVVGQGSSDSGYEAFIWDGGNGIRGLGGNSSIAHDITADGSVVVGTGSSGAFIWDSVNGVRSLQEVLTNDYGIDLSGWVLQTALAVSDVGTTIVGEGLNPDGNNEAWVVTLQENYSAALSGAIRTMQTLTGNENNQPAFPGGDVNGDQKSGLAEAIYALQVNLGMRPQPSSCDSNDVTLCSTSDDCTSAGGYWWSDNTCLGLPESETVISAGQKIWMDRNLGASQVATISTDSLAYGDLYQWGRGADGHQIRTSTNTSATSSIDDPVHGDFITTTASPSDWRVPQNGNLWQGVTGTNNPCPAGFRLPTEIEWETEKQSWASYDSAGAFASPLKLVTAGSRRSWGEVIDDFGYGSYWSSTILNEESYVNFINNDNVFWAMTEVRSSGNSVRCIKD